MMDIYEACKIIGVQEIDTEETIRRKYRALQKKWHPDLFMQDSKKQIIEAKEMSQKINQAKEVIDEYIKYNGIDNLVRIIKNPNKNDLDDFISTIISYYKQYKSHSYNNSEKREKKAKAQRSEEKTEKKKTSNTNWNFKESYFKRFTNTITNNPSYILKEDDDYFGIYCYYNFHIINIIILTHLDLYVNFIYTNNQDLVFIAKEEYVRNTSSKYDTFIEIYFTQKKVVDKLKIGDALHVTLDFDGIAFVPSVCGRRRYSIRTNDNTQVAYMVGNTFMSSVVDVLMREKIIKLCNAVVENTFPLKIKMTYKKLGKKQIEIKKYKKLFDELNELKLKIRDRRSAVKKGGMIFGDYRSVDWHLERFVLPINELPIDCSEELFRYCWSTRLYKQAKPFFDNFVPGELEIIDVFLDDSTLEDILSVCDSMNSLLEYLMETTSLCKYDGYYKIQYKKVISVIRFQKTKNNYSVNMHFFYK